MRIFGLWLAALLSLNGMLAAQSYSLPQELVYYGERQDVEFEAPNYGLMDRFYPIGWSKDAKFAYLVVPADEACGCFFMHLEIVDLVTDSVTRPWRFSDEDNPKADNNLKKIWKQEKNAIAAVLKKNGIVQQSDYGVRDCDMFRCGKGIYSLDMKTERRETDWNYFNAVTDATVSLHHANGKSKQVYEMHEKDYAATLECKLGGYLKYPHGRRLAVLMVRELRGWEGPPNVLTFDVIGAGVGAYFKK